MATRRDPFVGNPFTDAFWGKALKFLGVTKRYAQGSAVIDVIPMEGRLDDYFNKNYRDKTPGKVPRLRVDDKLWMSLTAMEVQASELSIQRAHGVVWTAGLGLGYFPLRCAQKDDVKEVHVVERDADVIKLFKKMHGRKRAAKKITIYHGDARKIIRNRTGDYCWMDTYQDIAQDDIPKDGAFYRKRNKFREYTFWGWEMIMLWALQFKIIETYQMPTYLLQYLRMWQRTPLEVEDSTGALDGMTLGNLAKTPCDKKFCRRCLNNAIDIQYT